MAELILSLSPSTIKNIRLIKCLLLRQSITFSSIHVMTLLGLMVEVRKPAEMILEWLSGSSFSGSFKMAEHMLVTWKMNLLNCSFYWKMRV